MTKAWPEVSLGETCTFQNGGTPSKKVPAYFGGDIPWLTGADIEGPSAGACRTFLTDAGIEASPACVVPEGTILLVTRTGVGKVAIANRSLSFSQDITALTPDRNQLDRRYLLRFLQTEAGRFKAESRGATIKGITREVVTSTKIPLPPLDEQRRIAAILDKADEVRSKRKAALETLETLSQAIFIEMFGDPVTNPMGWPACPLGEVATLQRGFDLPVQDRRLGPFPIFASNGTIGSHDDGPISGPGVITGRSGSIGRVHFAEDAFWPLNTSLFVKDFHGHEPRWVLYLLRTMKLERFHEGTGVPTLNRNVVHRVSVVVPPLNTQQLFSSLVCTVWEMEEVLRHTLLETEDLFASLQQKAFQGAL